MIYRFDGFEVDLAKRELRCGGEPRNLQPQAFRVLEYLIRHRERAVPKGELLEQLWPDTVVGEGSVQRAVHLARSAIQDDGERIRTVPRHGYRFTARVTEVTTPRSPDPANLRGFRPRFARSGDVHIAYHAMGEGELDIVLVPGWAFPMRAYLDHPSPRAMIQRLCALGRVVMFDKRGTGLSDRVKELPTLEQRMDDLRAVLDAVKSKQALLVAYSEGGPLCLLFATSYPQRTRGLLLVGSFARWAAAPDYACGWSPEVVERLRGYIGSDWGGGQTILAIAESRSDDPEVQAWAARAEQQGASPGAALELLEMNLQADVRPLLGAVDVPTAVLHHTGDAVISAECSRHLAAHIPGARLLEVEGHDHVFLFEHQSHMLELLEWLVDQPQAEHGERFLSTLLVVEAGATDAHPDLDALVARFRGVRTGDGCFTFDGPQRALHAAHALQRRLAQEARVGIHTGEVVRQGSRIVGDAVSVARTLARSAENGEVCVSQVVRDLVYGSAFEFTSRASVRLEDGRELRVLKCGEP